MRKTNCFMRKVKCFTRKSNADPMMCIGIWVYIYRAACLFKAISLCYLLTGGLIARKWNHQHVRRLLDTECCLTVTLCSVSIQIKHKHLNSYTTLYMQSKLTNNKNK